MADTFPLSGNIDPKTFAFLLVDLHRRGATGSLKVEGPTHPKALYFRGGRVLFGSSNDPKDQLGAILIENGKITQEQLDDVNTKVGPGNPLAKVLAESGYVNQRELGEAARVKVERILSDVIAYEKGSFEFEDGVLPKGAVDLKLSTEKLLLAAVSRITDRGFVLRQLESMGVVLSPAPDWVSRISEIRAEVGGLLERLDGQRSLKEAVALTRFEEFDGAKLACGLLFLGLATKTAGAPAAAGSDELDLGDTARGAFGSGGEEESPTLPSEAPDHEAPFFASDSPFPSPSPEPEGSPSAFAESDIPAFASDAGSPPTDAFPSSDIFPSPEAFGAEPTSRAVVAPSVEAPRASEPPGSSYAEPASKDFAMSSGPELGFPSPEPAVRAPFPPPASKAPPPNTAEFPALGAPHPEPAPAYRPPVPAPLPAEPDEPVPVPPSRPSKEDLAALDALLNPGGVAPGSPSASMNPSSSMRMRSQVPRPSTQRWEPQFRPSSQSGARRAPHPRRPIVPLAVAALLIVAVSGAGYYFLFPQTSSSTSRSGPETRPTPPPTLAPTPAALPSAAGASPAVTPTPADIPSAAANVSTPPITAAPATLPPVTAPPATTPPVSAPPLTAPPATAPPATAPKHPAGGGNPRALLRAGAFGEAAQGFVSEVKRAGPRFSVQVLVACSTDTVQKALDNVPSDDLFILPVNYRGKSCYRICWGLYESQDRAMAALQSMPAYFRQGGAAPKVSPAAALLP